MARDLDLYQVCQQRGQYVARATQLILSAVGQPNGASTQFRGKTYELEQTVGRLTIRKLDPQSKIILEVVQGKTQRTVVTIEDCQRFKAFVMRLERDQHKATYGLSSVER